MEYTDLSTLLEKLRLVTKLTKQQNFPGALYALEYCRQTMQAHIEEQHRARTTPESTPHE